jgi:hypothetical protein
MCKVLGIRSDSRCGFLVDLCDFLSFCNPLFCAVWLASLRHLTDGMACAVCTAIEKYRSGRFR